MSMPSFLSTDTDTAWLNPAKVVAICAVVAIHTFGYNAVVENARTTKLGLVAIGVHATSVFSVPLFVMVSGALLLDPKRFTTAKAFMTKRTLRLVPALVFWHAVYFLFRRFYLGQALDAGTYLVQTIGGRAFQGLYYFWVILGLVAITPILAPWVGQASKRQVALAGLTMAAMPILTLATHGIRGRSEIWIETAWTWWIFYLGFYLLGWALRDLVLSRGATVVALLSVLAIASAEIFAWRNPAAPPQFARWVSGYYSLATLVYTGLIFTLIHSLTTAHRPLHWSVNGGAARVTQRMASVTLGVFGIHSAIILVVIRTGILGEGNAAPAWELLLARYVLVVMAAFAISLIMQKVPVLKRIV